MVAIDFAKLSEVSDFGSEDKLILVTLSVEPGAPKLKAVN